MTYETLKSQYEQGLITVTDFMRGLMSLGVGPTLALYIVKGLTAVPEQRAIKWFNAMLHKEAHDQESDLMSPENDPEWVAFYRSLPKLPMVLGLL